MRSSMKFCMTLILLVTAGTMVAAGECLEMNFEMTDTVYTIPGDFFVTGVFELTNCGDEQVRVWIESDSPIVTFGQIRGRHKLDAGETYFRHFKFPVPPPIAAGTYDICVYVMVHDTVYDACETLVVLKEPPVERTARLQIIHNAADPDADTVDVWVNGELLLDDFAFRTATPLAEVPAGIDLVIGIAGAGSMTQDDALATFTFNLAADESYVAVASGVLTPENFASNPDGIDIGFDIFARDGLIDTAEADTEVAFFAFHGASDAPTVDVVAREVAIVVDDLTYGSFTDYATVPAAGYILDVTPGDDNSTVVASFAADLSTLGGQTAIVFASGFLTPEDNAGGPAFGLFAALADGTVVAFAPVGETGIDDYYGPDNYPERFSLSNYPNPFNPATTIAFDLPRAARVTLSVSNLLGRKVSTLVSGELMRAGHHTIDWNGRTDDGTAAASGVYFYRLTVDEQVHTKKMLMIR